MPKLEDPQIRTYDYVVAGSGLAGLMVAIRAANYGSVAIVTKSWLRESNSYYAQGGIAAVTDKDDHPKNHFDDTIEAGRGLCDFPAVEALVNEAPLRIQDLIRDGMKFDQLNGSIALGLEGGHSHRRILHAGGDATGALVTSFLASKVAEHPSIDIYENHAVLELLMRSKTCWGVRTWNISGKYESLFVGRHTYMALGGTSAIYQRSTNPSTAAGEGVAICYEAGCQVEDIEFIQFHPTALYVPNKPAFLISEAVRGEGAHLLNARGERFMYGHYPLAELEPRDTVARAIFREIQRQKEPFVWLDLRHLNPKKLRERFPTIYRHCQEAGFSLTEKIPVSPAAHYMVGGIRTNLYGESGVPNLYICGELANTGIMGANRLASNSLIECLVFGYRAVEQSLLVPHVEAPTDFGPKFTLEPGNQVFYQSIRQRLSQILNSQVGIIRSGHSLCFAQEDLDTLEEGIEQVPTEVFLHLSRCLITVASRIVQGALYREESRGGHFRADFPTPDPKYLCHVIQQKGKAIGRIPVITRDKQ